LHFWSSFDYLLAFLSDFFVFCLLVAGFLQQVSKKCDFSFFLQLLSSSMNLWQIFYNRLEKK